MNTKIKKGLVIAASAAALFTAGCASHGTSHKSDMHSSSHGASCSGQGSCKTAGACRQVASCKGLSACKGVSNTKNLKRNVASTDNFNNYDEAYPTS